MSEICGAHDEGSFTCSASVLLNGPKEARSNGAMQHCMSDATDASF
jgi:hypothetical protein